jgi:NAD(P)-dependent dehydrogenase (short-subunit alcohol dehydrogenase family)
LEGNERNRHEPLSSYDVQGQVAVVTGAGAGMGRDTARAFATAGAAVVLADVNQDALRAATDELTAAGHQALGVVCDVADEAQVAALVDRTADTFGRLDMAFNNAGIMIPFERKSWSTRRAACASTPSAPAPSRRRWSPT